MGWTQERLRNWDLKGIRSDVDRALSRKSREKAPSDLLLSAAWLLLANPDEDYCDPALARELYQQAGGDDTEPGALKLAVKSALQFDAGDVRGALATLEAECPPPEADPSFILLAMTGTLYPSDLQEAYEGGSSYFMPGF